MWKNNSHRTPWDTVGHRGTPGHTVAVKLLESVAAIKLVKIRMIFWYVFSYMEYSPNSVATLRGSYSKSKGPVFNRAGRTSVRHLSCKFPHKMALVTCACPFQLRRLAQSVLPRLGISFPPVCSLMCAPLVLSYM